MTKILRRDVMEIKVMMKKDAMRFTALFKVKEVDCFISKNCNMTKELIRSDIKLIKQ